MSHGMGDFTRDNNLSAVCKKDLVFNFEKRMKKIFHSERKNAILNSEHYDKVIIPIIRIIFIGTTDEIRCSGFTWMRCISLGDKPQA